MVESRIVDFLVITAIPEELEATATRLNRVSTITSPAGNNVLLGTIEGFSRDRTLAVSRSVEQGTAAAQALTHDLLSIIDPHWIALIGIAGSRPDPEYSLGDVVLATYVHDFSVQARLADGATEYSIKGHPIDSTVASYLATLKVHQDVLDGWNTAAAIRTPCPIVDFRKLALSGPHEWRTKIRRSLRVNFGSGTRAPRFLDGEIASSNDLLKDPLQLIPRLVSARQTKAVEMEAAGVLRAATRPVVIVKGISDIVGLRREDSWKIYAANTAASLAFTILETCDLPGDKRTHPSRAPRRERDQEALPSHHAAKELLRKIEADARAIREREPQRKGVRKVTRDELETIIAAARASAKETAVSLCGDLSWIGRDRPILRALQVARPQVATTIYYENGSVTAEAARLLDDLQTLRINFRPFPIRLNRLKALVIDRWTERQWALVFNRIPRSDLSSGEKNKEFHLRFVEQNDWISLECLNAVIASLEMTATPPFLLGVIGVNNVGKTTLIKHLASELETRGFRQVDVVPDAFKGAAATSSVEENVALLWRQKVNEDAITGATVRLLDRTSIDHLCFLSLRGGQKIAERLMPLIQAQAKRYNLLVDVRRSDGDYSTTTGHLIGSDRAKFRDLLDHFLRDGYLEPYVLHVDPDNFATSLKTSAEGLAARVREELLVRPRERPG